MANKKIKVSCKSCGIEWMKFQCDINKWQGNCRKCSKKGMQIAKFGKGKPKSESHRIKIGNAHKGKPKLYMKGEKNFNWNGGVTSEYNKLRTSLEFKNWRREVFERDKYTCQSCGDATGGNLHAHHIKSFAFYPNHRFDIDNGQTLCEKCHKKTDNWGHKAKKDKTINSKLKEIK